MDNAGSFDTSGTSADCLGAVASVAPAQRGGNRTVRDRLPDSFVLERSESEWLLTLLSADELRYIFEGSNHGETKD